MSLIVCIEAVHWLLFSQTTSCRKIERHFTGLFSFAASHVTWWCCLSCVSTTA